MAWRWARGQRLDRVLERAELAPGDFVRNIKQLIDLLRQLAVVGRPDTAAAARQAVEQLQRGVVAASAAPALATDDVGSPPSPGPDCAGPRSKGGAGLRAGNRGSATPAPSRS